MMFESHSYVRKSECLAHSAVEIDLVLLLILRVTEWSQSYIRSSHIRRKKGEQKFEYVSFSRR